MIWPGPTNTALLNILEGGKGTKEGMTRGIKGGENAKSEKGEAEWGGGLKGKVSKWGNREKEQGRAGVVALRVARFRSHGWVFGGARVTWRDSRIPHGNSAD